jgi:hypothetical protein
MYIRGLSANNGEGIIMIRVCGEILWRGEVGQIFLVDFYWFDWFKVTQCVWRQFYFEKAWNSTGPVAAE